MNPFISKMGYTFFKMNFRSLKLNKVVFIFKDKLITPKTSGILPEARQKHSACLNYKKAYYIIYGGFFNNNVLQDIHVLNL